jgi:hypothetical protein
MMDIAKKQFKQIPKKLLCNARSLASAAVWAEIYSILGCFME